jgi:lactate permease
VGAILVVTRVNWGASVVDGKTVFAFPLKAMLNQNYGLFDFRNLLGYAGVNENSIKLLYLPGTVPFTLVSILCIWMHKMPSDKVKAAWNKTFKQIVPAAITLCASVALVKIFQGSGNFTNKDLIAKLAEQGMQNTSLPSIPRAMAEAIAALCGPVWPAVSYFVGGLGAFITGSNTVSDVLFGQFQWDVAELRGLSRVVMLSVQGVGGAGGNMICVNNVVAVCTVVGLLGREGDIIKKTFPPFVLYGAVTAIIAFILLGVGYHGTLPAVF